MLSKFVSLFRRRVRQRIAPITSDADHQAAIELLTKEILNPTNEAFPPLGGNLDHNGSGIIIGAWDEGDLVAAVFAGPDVQSARDAVQNGRPEYADTFRRRIVVIHGIATCPESRHEGVARALLTTVEYLAFDKEYEFTVAVPTTSEAQEFFTQCGYLVFDERVALMLRPDDFDVPITIPNIGHRWAVRPLSDGDNLHLRIGQAVLPADATQGKISGIKARWLW